MQIQLSQKERMLLEDEKNQEEICVIKYQNYSQIAQDPELKQLFQTLSKEEQKHYDAVNQLLSGQQPSMAMGDQSGSQSSGKSSGSQMTQGNENLAGQINPTNPPSQINAGSQSDKVLVSDLLSTEKFVSGIYDGAIFESANPTVRQTLQHIQKEEQKHGHQLFQYMNSHGMYQVK